MTNLQTIGERREEITSSLHLVGAISVRIHDHVKSFFGNGLIERVVFVYTEIAEMYLLYCIGLETTLVITKCNTGSRITILADTTKSKRSH